ncbi:hypothetical protein RJ55_02503 [Drechmeria coniospora]|nr:hypothetical protein RJ55_02503 [Drechmeria coniospora]
MTPAAPYECIPWTGILFVAGARTLDLVGPRYSNIAGIYSSPGTSAILSRPLTHAPSPLGSARFLSVTRDKVSHLSEDPGPFEFAADGQRKDATTYLHPSSPVWQYPLLILPFRLLSPPLFCLLPPLSLTHRCRLVFLESCRE